MTVRLIKTFAISPRDVTELAGGQHRLPPIAWEEGNSLMTAG